MANDTYVYVEGTGWVPVYQVAAWDGQAWTDPPKVWDDTASEWLTLPGTRPPTGEPGFVIGTTLPSSSTTGVPAGTALTVQSTDITYTTPGQVIEGVDFACFVRVAAANVTFRNCRFRGRDTGYVSLTSGHLLYCNDSTSAGLLLDRCTFAADYPRWWLNGVYGQGFTARRCDFSAVVDGIMVRQGGATTIEGCYFHDFYFSDQSQDQAASNPPYWTHNDGIQYRVGGPGGPHIARGNHFAWYPGEGAKFDRNSVLETGAAGTYYPRSMRSPLTGRLLWGAGITMSPDFGPYPTNLDVDSNWFDGGTACLQMGHTAASGAFTVGTIHGNRVGADQYNYSTTVTDKYQLRWTSQLTVTDYVGTNSWAEFSTVSESLWGTALTVGFTGGIRIT